jgi:hypothetical protein
LRIANVRRWRCFSLAASSFLRWLSATRKDGDFRLCRNRKAGRCRRSQISVRQRIRRAEIRGARFAEAGIVDCPCDGFGSNSGVSTSCYRCGFARASV